MHKIHEKEIRTLMAKNLRALARRINNNHCLLKQSEYMLVLATKFKEYIDDMEKIEKCNLKKSSKMPSSNSST